jgi:phage terminase small subunit
MAGSLTPKQQRFVEEYLIEPNATSAYAKAYGAKGAAAESNGARMIRNDKVAEAIRIAQGDRAKRTGVTADRVLEELAVVGFSDPRHYKASGNGLVVLPDAPQSAMRAVSSVKQKIKTDEETGDLVTDLEFKFWDKNSALEKIGKHLGMFVERHQHEVSIGDIRGRVAQTLDAVRRHTDADTYAAIVKEVRPIWK